MNESIIINSENYGQYNYIIPNIKYCAEDKYESFWELKERTIEEYEFIFITRGTGQFSIQGTPYDVKTNDLILLEPCKNHRGNSVETPFHFLCMHFEVYAAKDIISDSLHNYEKNDIKSLCYHKAQIEFPEYTPVSDSSYIHILLKRIINEAATRPAGFNLIIKSLFTDLLVNLFREQDLVLDLGKIPDQVKAVIKYIKTNHMNNIKLSDLSEHIHLQPAYLSNLFRKHTGYTITDYIKYYRLIEAKRLLLETERKIEDIACSLGFYDIHHFSKVFKDEEGVAPAQYRNVKRK